MAPDRGTQPDPADVRLTRRVDRYAQPSARRCVGPIMEAVTSGGGSRSEGSLVTSLAELRALELERQAEERAAAEATAAARHREREAAVQAARDAVAARIAAERAAELAAEQARAAAEREARLQIEKIEATERARRLVALEEHRVAEELALRREAALRQRPRWLLALLSVAFATTAWLGWFALECRREADGARDRATADRAAAEADARPMHEALDRKAHEIAALEAQLADANRRADEARRDADAHAGPPPHRGPVPGGPRRPPEAEHPPRPVPVQISDDCLVNPLCNEKASHPGDPQTGRK